VDADPRLHPQPRLPEDALERLAADPGEPPHRLPAAISFRKFHLLHHRFQGDPELDADLASPLEARLVGNSTLGKAFGC
jgi:hypothetical protein